MARGELQTKKLKLKIFDKGYFPNAEFDAVPDGGSPDCRHVLHRWSDLRPFPGMAPVNTVQASLTSGQGLHYLNTDDVTKRVAVFGTKLYSDNSGVWTAVTGTADIGNGSLVHMIDHQQGANQYVIGAPGSGKPPFKWTGTGGAAPLGGSPPNFETIAKYHNIIFGAVDENVYFSDDGDPETWNTGQWVIPFSKTVTRLEENGSKLAVMKSQSVGSIQGFDALDFVEEDQEISEFGCVGKLAATRCVWGQDAGQLNTVATIAENGLWVFDGGFSATKVFGDNWIQQFNKSNLRKSSIAYWQDESLLFCAMPYGGSTEPDHLTIVNTRTGAFWPGPSIHANSIRSLARMKDDDGREFVYFVDSNGFAFKFDMDVSSYHTGTETELIDFKWRSKIIDLDDIYTFGELTMVAGAVGNWGITVGLHFGLGLGDGSSNAINFQSAGSLLGAIILGATTLSGSNYIFKALEGIGGFGRFLQITLTPQGLESADLLSSTFILGESVLGSQSTFRVKFMEAHLHFGRGGGIDQ